MTREFYNKRLTDLMKSIEDFAEAGKYNEARMFYGQCVELINIVAYEGVISADELLTENEKVKDCFYNSL